MKEIEKKQIIKEMDKAFNSLEINTESDEEFLSKNNFNWDDLNKLKEELSKDVIEFIIQVKSILDRKDIIDNLGENKDEFNRTLETFFNDLNNFSKKIKELSNKHSNKKGPITTISDFNVYNKLSIEYHFHTTELLELLGPTLSNLILITNETASKIEQKQNSIKENKEEEVKND